MATPVSDRTGPAPNGTLTLNADGSFSLHAGRQLQRPGRLHLQVTDGPSNSNVATVALTVVATNDAPVAVERRVHDRRRHAADVAAPACSAERQRIRRAMRCRPALVSEPANGSLTFNADGSFSYTPDAELHRHGQLHLHGERRRARARTWPRSRITVTAGQRRTGGGRRRLQRRTEDTPLTSRRPACSATTPTPTATR